MGRAAYAACAAITVALGLGSRLWRSGVPLLDKSLGDGLYGAMAYWLVSALLPARSARMRALGAAGFCAAIEAFKLTGLPQAWVHWRLSRLVLGTTPSWHNLVCYGVGVLLAAALERAWRAR